VNSQRNSYLQLFRLKEEKSQNIDESTLQRAWFEQVYETPLQTTDGKNIRIVQPGFWNHAGGPDFLHACIELENGERLKGCVEIDLEETGWTQHGHDNNLQYENTILHVFWKKAPQTFFARTAQNRSVVQVDLSHQLKTPLSEITSLFSTSRGEREAGAIIGRCEKTLRDLPTDQILSLLQDAGLYRMENKRRLWQMRARVLGKEQSLWIGIAEALGYSENKNAFRAIAQKLPIETLLSISSDEKREAMLYGIAGFLPHNQPSHDSQKIWQKTLWEHWWKQRSEWSDFILPPSCWKLAGIRPQNRPERRLAALTCLSSQRVWKKLCALAQNQRWEDLKNLFSELHHSFWNHHYTFQSKAVAKSIALIGPDRIQSILFNIFIPLFTFTGELIHKSPVFLQNTSPSRPEKIATVRLLGNRRIPPASRTVLIQEGLLQIYQDFCLNNSDLCETCEFPELLKKNLPSTTSAV
jgi:hypothetical protein